MVGLGNLLTTSCLLSSFLQQRREEKFLAHSLPQNLMVPAKPDGPQHYRNVLGFPSCLERAGREGDEQFRQLGSASWDLAVPNSALALLQAALPSLLRRLPHALGTCYHLAWHNSASPSGLLLLSPQ